MALLQPSRTSSAAGGVGWSLQDAVTPTKTATVGLKKAVSAKDVLELFKEEMGEYPSDALSLVTFSEKHTGMETLSVAAASSQIKELFGAHEETSCRTSRASEKSDCLAEYYETKAKARTSRRQTTIKTMMSASSVDRDVVLLDAEAAEEAKRKDFQIFMQSLSIQECGEESEGSSDEGPETRLTVDEGRLSPIGGRLDAMDVPPKRVSASASASTSHARSEHYISIDEYLNTKCLPSITGADCIKYQRGLLLFARRLCDSMIELLTAIENATLMVTNEFDRKSLTELVEYWLKKYPKDFEKSLRMQGKMIEIQTAAAMASVCFFFSNFFSGKMSADEISSMRIGDLIMESKPQESKPTERLLEEYPMPAEELTYAIRGGHGTVGANVNAMVDLNQNPKTQNDTSEMSEAERKEAFPETSESYSFFRPNSRMVKKEWWPKPLVESEVRRSDDDERWMQQFGVVDPEMRQWLLEPVAPDKVFEECWEVEEEYIKCKRARVYARHGECKGIKKKVKRCRALEHMARLKGLQGSTLLTGAI